MTSAKGIISNRAQDVKQQAYYYAETAQFESLLGASAAT